jgi:hypothetical protein
MAFALCYFLFWAALVAILLVVAVVQYYKEILCFIAQLDPDLAAVLIFCLCCLGGFISGGMLHEAEHPGHLFVGFGTALAGVPLAIGVHKGLRKAQKPKKPKVPKASVVKR